MSDINKIAENLQAKILEQIKKEYSKKVIDHWQNPRNWGIMDKADGYGKITGPCGDTMEISISAKNNKIVKCTFDTDGCGTSISCGSMITEMAIEKSIIEAKKITKKIVLDYCGGLPEEDRHCALLAANTLQAAIKNYEETKNESWKKLYRKP